MSIRRSHAPHASSSRHPDARRPAPCRSPRARSKSRAAGPSRTTAPAPSAPGTAHDRTSSAGRTASTPGPAPPVSRRRCGRPRRRGGLRLAVVENLGGGPLPAFVHGEAVDPLRLARRIVRQPHGRIGDHVEEDGHVAEQRPGPASPRPRSASAIPPASDVHLNSLALLCFPAAVEPNRGRSCHSPAAGSPERRRPPVAS